MFNKLQTRSIDSFHRGQLLWLFHTVHLSCGNRHELLGWFYCKNRHSLSALITTREVSTDFFSLLEGVEDSSCNHRRPSNDFAKVYHLRECSCDTTGNDWCSAGSLHILSVSHECRSHRRSLLYISGTVGIYSSWHIHEGDDRCRSRLPRPAQGDEIREEGREERRTHLIALLATTEHRAGSPVVRFQTIADEVFIFLTTEDTRTEREGVRWRVMVRWRLLLWSEFRFISNARWSLSIESCRRTRFTRSTFWFKLNPTRHQTGSTLICSPTDFCISRAVCCFF